MDLNSTAIDARETCEIVFDEDPCFVWKLEVTRVNDSDDSLENLILC